MIGEYYDYKGEKLTQAQIAQREGINRSTLADWFKRTGSMESAVEGAKKSLAQRNIDNHNPISLTDLRLVRRIVRDLKFRNTIFESNSVDNNNTVITNY